MPEAYDWAVKRALMLVLATLAAGVLAGPVFAAPALKKLTVVLKAQDHHPLVGKKWHYQVTVTGASGKRVACRIHLQFLFSGAPVGQVGSYAVKSGFFQQTLGTPGNQAFPAAAMGQALVLEAIVTAPGYAAATAKWPLVVK
jgi:hypothetical protein